MLRTAKQKYLNKLKSFEKKQFWKAVKSLNRQKTPTLSENSIEASTNFEKAEILNSFPQVY